MWLALNIVVTGLLAVAASFLTILLSNALKLKSLRVVGPVMAATLTIITLFALMKLLMQFTHVAPAAGSIHLVLGCLVALITAPASFAWFFKRGLASA